MTYTALRQYIKHANVRKYSSIKDCNIVIDGDSYFKDSYRDSGCQFIVGPECDLYAKYLINKLIIFKKCNITCYVIFKGTTKQDLCRRQEKHQSLLKERSVTEDNIWNCKYTEPSLVKDVQKEVLDMLGIRYYCCEYSSLDAIVGVARTYKCPVISNNLEYLLYGVTCILPKDILYENSYETLKSAIYEHDILKAFFGVYNKTPILMTLLNENFDFSDVIPDWYYCIKNNDIRPLIRWIKRQKENIINDISNKFVDENKKNILIHTYKKNVILYLCPTHNSAARYFKRINPYGLFKDDKKWLSKGVSNGRIAIPYIDIKKRDLVTGSTTLYNENKPDALLAAKRIIAYSHCLLTNSQKSTLNFIGRKNTDCTVWEQELEYDKKVYNRSIFNKHSKCKKNDYVENPFWLFIDDVLGTPNSWYRRCFLENNDHKILCFSLVYYILENKTFINAAYFVLLSYIITREVRLENYPDISKPENEEYIKMYNVFTDSFNNIDIKHRYNVDFIHSLNEFQYCLQHINYLNKLCDNYLPGTVYSRTYNATFVYNAFIKFENKDNLKTYLKLNFGNFNLYKMFEKLVSDFDKLVAHIEF